MFLIELNIPFGIRVKNDKLYITVLPLGQVAQHWSGGRTESTQGGIMQSAIAHMGRPL